MLIGLPDQLSKCSLPALMVGDSELTATSSARTIWAIFDNHLKFDKRVDTYTIFRESRFQLRTNGRIHRYRSGQTGIVDAGSRAAHLSAGFHKQLTTWTLERAIAEAATGAECCCSNGVGAIISDHIILVLLGSLAASSCTHHFKTSANLQGP